MGNNNSTTLEIDREHGVIPKRIKAEGPCRSQRIQLESLLAADEKTLAVVRKGFKKRGYVLVSLAHAKEEEHSKTQVLMSHVASTVTQAEKFFTETPAEEKKTFSFKRWGHHLGYVDARHKEGLRYLSGDAMDGSDPLKLSEFVAFCDQLSIDILDVFCRAGFYGKHLSTAEEFGRQYGIPLLTGEVVKRKSHQKKKNGESGKEEEEEEEKETSSEKARTALFDIAYYKNSLEISEWLAGRGLNCEEHWDPGVFAFHFCSTAPGLQLYDYSVDKWYDMPSDGEQVGVIWCGDLATVAQKAFKACIHRVERGAIPRLGIWHEIVPDTHLMQIETTEMSEDGVDLPNILQRDHYKNLVKKMGKKWTNPKNLDRRIEEEFGIGMKPLFDDTAHRNKMFGVTPSDQ